MEKIFSKQRIYPTLTAKNNPNPHKIWAIPLLGFFLKIIILIPVFVELYVLALVWLLLTVINSLFVLLTGKYWDTYYNFNLGFMRLTTKLSFYFYGVTDIYPGFDFASNDSSSVMYPKPQNPNRLFAIPVLGIVIRGVLLIPFILYLNVISYAAFMAMFWSWIKVLFKGKYPDTTFELVRDTVRLNLASTAYITGLTETYPSFYVEMGKNVVIKGVLIAIAALYMAQSLASSASTYMLLLTHPELLKQKQQNDLNKLNNMYNTNGSSDYTYPSESPEPTEEQ